MHRGHILLIMGREENALPVTLLLETHGFLVTIAVKNNQVIDQICHIQNGSVPIDLLIIGTIISEKSLQDLFNNLKKLRINLSFIIFSDEYYPNLLDRLWESGFYGSYMEPSDSGLLIPRVEFTFKNINRYREIVGSQKVKK